MGVGWIDVELGLLNHFHSLIQPNTFFKRSIVEVDIVVL